MTIIAIFLFPFRAFAYNGAAIRLAQVLTIQARQQGFVGRDAASEANLKIAGLAISEIKLPLLSANLPSPLMGEGQGGGEKETQIKNYLESGNRPQALLTAKEMLRQDPDNPRVRQIAEKLEQAPQESELSISSGQKNLEPLWEKAKKEKSYPDLKELTARVAKAEIRPPYYAELLTLFDQVRNDLSRKSEVRYREAMHLQDPIARGEALQKILAGYPDFEKGQQELARLYETLSDANFPLWVRAETLQQLDGCSKALPLYEALIRKTHFSAIPLHQKAIQAVKECTG